MPHGGRLSRLTHGHGRVRYSIRGYGIASRRWSSPQIQLTVRSIPNPNPACPVGAGIQATLERAFGDAQRALEDRLAGMTLAEIVRDLRAEAATRRTANVS